MYVHSPVWLTWLTCHTDNWTPAHMSNEHIMRRLDWHNIPIGTTHVTVTVNWVSQWCGKKMNKTLLRHDPKQKMRSWLKHFDRVWWEQVADALHIPFCSYIDASLCHLSQVTQLYWLFCSVIHMWLAPAITILKWFFSVTISVTVTMTLNSIIYCDWWFVIVDVDVCFFFRSTWFQEGWGSWGWGRG